MRVLICGSCSWQEIEPIWSVMAGYSGECNDKGKPLAFISGMAVGADTIAWEVANELHEYCDDFPWNQRGRRKARYNLGGKEPDKMRNQWMLDSGVDVCHAFAYDIRTSYGTRDMVNRCIRSGKVKVYWFDGECHRRISSRVTDSTNIGTEMEVVDLRTVVFA